MAHRCIKCDQHHDYRQCTKTKDDDVKASIVVLPTQLHSKASLNFPKLIEIISIPVPYTPKNLFHSPLNQLLPYRNPPQNSPPPQSNIQNTINLNKLATTLNKIAGELSVQNFAELIEKYKQILQNLKEASTLQYKILIITTDLGQQS